MDTPILQCIHEIVLFGPKKQGNSYPTLQDKKYAVEKFLNEKVQEAMGCLDTQEPSDNTSSTPDEVPNNEIPNTHDQTMDQTPHTYHASKHKHSTPLREIPTNLTYHVVQVLQAKHEFLVDRGANGDLASSRLR